MNTSGRIVISDTNQDTYQFQFRTGYGECLLRGPARASRQLALQDAACLLRCACEDGSYAVCRDDRGNFYFHFISEEGETIGTSPPYPSPESMGKAIALLKAGAPGAEVVDAA